MLCSVATPNTCSELCMQRTNFKFFRVLNYKVYSHTKILWASGLLWLHEFVSCFVPYPLFTVAELRRTTQNFVMSGTTSSSFWLRLPAGSSFPHDYRSLGKFLHTNCSILLLPCLARQAYALLSSGDLQSVHVLPFLCFLKFSVGSKGACR